MELLLPCPFCGSDEITEGFNLNIIGIEDYCRCMKCNSVAHTKIWNTRHTPWISVKDKYPERDEYVLLRSGRFRCIGYLEEDCFIFDENILPGVTHWMPLPQLPEGKK